MNHTDTRFSPSYPAGKTSGAGRARLGRARLVALALAVSALAAPSAARADLSMETETARPVAPGHVELSLAYEYQTSSQGQEHDLPLAIEFGLYKDLEMLIEPVPFTSIKPKGEKAVTGLGDVEVTLSYLAVHETKYVPALAIAGEVKIPTARNLQIGTRSTDWRIYGIASKRITFNPTFDFDVHFNIGYTFIGQPSGVKTKNPIDLALAVEWFVHPKFDLFAEVTYTASSLDASGTSATGGGGEVSSTAVHRVAHPFADTSDTGGTTGGTARAGRRTAEIAGEEIVGTVGARYHLRKDVDLFGSLSYDNNDATLFRVGVVWRP